MIWIILALLCSLCLATERLPSPLQQSEQEDVEPLDDLITLYLEDNFTLFQETLERVMPDLITVLRDFHWITLASVVRFDLKYQNLFLESSAALLRTYEDQLVMCENLDKKYPLHYAISDVCLKILVGRHPLQSFIDAYKYAWKTNKMKIPAQALELLLQVYKADDCMQLVELEYLPLHLYANHLLKAEAKDNFEWLFKNGQSADILMNLDFPLIVSKLDWTRRIPTEIHEHIIKNRALDNSLYRNYAENLDTFPNEKVCLCDFSSSFGLTVLLKNSFFHSWKKCGPKIVEMAVAVLNRDSIDMVKYVQFVVKTPYANVKDVFEFTQLIKKSPFLADIAESIFTDHFTPFFLSKPQSQEEIFAFYTAIGIPSHPILKAKLLLECLNHKMEACYKAIIASEENAFAFTRFIKENQEEYFEYAIALAHERNQVPSVPVQLYYATVKGRADLMPQKIETIHCYAIELLLAVKRDHQIFKFILEHCALSLHQTNSPFLNQMTRAYFSHPQRYEEVEYFVLSTMNNLIDASARAYAELSNIVSGEQIDVPARFKYSLSHENSYKDFERLEQEILTANSLSKGERAELICEKSIGNPNFLYFLFTKYAFDILSQKYFLSSVLKCLARKGIFGYQQKIYSSLVPKSLKDSLFSEFVIYVSRGDRKENLKNFDLYLNLLYDVCDYQNNDYIFEILHIVSDCFSLLTKKSQSKRQSKSQSRRLELANGMDNLLRNLQIERDYIINSIKEIIRSNQDVFEEFIIRGLNENIKIFEHFEAIYKDSYLLPLDSRIRLSKDVSQYFISNWKYFFNGKKQISDSTITLLADNLGCNILLLINILNEDKEIIRKFVDAMMDPPERLRMIAEERILGVEDEFSDHPLVHARSAIFYKDKQALFSIPPKWKQFLTSSLSDFKSSYTPLFQVETRATFEHAFLFAKLVKSSNIPFINLSVYIRAIDSQGLGVGLLKHWISDACNLFSREFFTTTKDHFLIPKKIELTQENVTWLQVFGIILAFAFSKKFTVAFDLLQPLWKLISNYREVLSDSDLMLVNPDTFGFVLGGQLDQLLLNDASDIMEFDFNYDGKKLVSEERKLDSSSVAEFKDKVGEEMRKYLSSFFTPISRAFVEYASVDFKFIIESDPLFIMESLKGRSSVSLDEWKNFVHFENFTADDIEMFWLVLQEIGEEKRTLLFKFVTGHNRMPSYNFDSIKPSFTVNFSNDSTRLPTALTCHNYLNIGRYGSKDALKEKLLLAIKSNDLEIQ